MQQVDTDVDADADADPHSSKPCPRQTLARPMYDPLGRIAPHATWRMSLNSHVWPSRAQIGPPIGEWERAR